MTDELIQGARDLLRRRDRAALATGLPGAFSGWPYASLVLVAVDHDLSPLLLMSDLAEHSKASQADPRASLLLEASEGLDQPLTGERLTLLGRVQPVDDERLRQRYLRRHPDAAAYAAFADFRLYRMTLERAHLVAGFGKIRWLSAAEIAPAVLPGLAEAEAGIVAHMNEDHGDAVRLYAERLLGRPGGPWQITGIDGDGIDLRLGGTVARLRFDPPLAGLAEVRQRLVELVAQARSV